MRWIISSTSLNTYLPTVRWWGEGAVGLGACQPTSYVPHLQSGGNPSTSPRNGYKPRQPSLAACRIWRGSPPWIRATPKIIANRNYQRRL